MSFLRNPFKKAAGRSIPPNYLIAGDMKMILGAICRPGGTETKRIEDTQGNYATYTFSNEVDGKTFELQAEIHREGKDYKTHVIAEKSEKPGVYEVKSILFDNEQEKLENPKEIYDVLNYIGVNHVRGVYYKSLPHPHENKGPFSKLGRFMTRHLPQPKENTWLIKP